MDTICDWYQPEDSYVHVLRSRQYLHCTIHYSFVHKIKELPRLNSKAGISLQDGGPGSIIAVRNPLS
jgi:hypothetical protein